MDEGKFLIELARNAVKEYLKTRKHITIPENTPKKMLKECGVFVTINKLVHGEKQLRGCIGYPYPTAPLVEAVINSAINAATQDPRFPSLSAKELDEVVFEVSVLTRDKATRSAFSEKMVTGDYDILHFSGHGSFDPATPETSAIRFADGILTADDILDLKWKAPPYLVFNTACESGRAAGGRRLVSNKNHSNGLAAAFIAAGASAYAGYFWPVTETGASLFTKAFYRTLFERENVGLAFLEARQYVARQLDEVGELTGYSAVLFGDAASKHRRDLATAV